MLRVESLDVSYGSLQVVWDVSLAVSAQEIVTILGPNGAGKSTLLNAISGLVPGRSGVIEFGGQRIDELPTHKIVEHGVSHVLERRRVFPYLTVEENLLLGSWSARGRATRGDNFARVFRLLPALHSKMQVEARYLSGGQQQQLAIGRGLMAAPEMLMLDEPFLGLHPSIMQEVVRLIHNLRDEGMTIVFIEQNVDLALEMSDRAYVLSSGRVALSGNSAELAKGDAVSSLFMGN